MSNRQILRTQGGYNILIKNHKEYGVKAAWACFKALACAELTRFKLNLGGHLMPHLLLNHPLIETM